MNRILREKFVELYSMPILEDVSMSTVKISFLDKRISGSPQYLLLFLFLKLLLWVIVYMVSCFQLLESFQESYPALTFPPLPKRGDFDLREVLESPYFFNWEPIALKQQIPFFKMLCSCSETSIWGFYARMIGATSIPMKHESFILFLRWHFSRSPCFSWLTTYALCSRRA